jgi:hypothetical protein
LKKRSKKLLLPGVRVVATKRGRRSERFLVLAGRAAPFFKKELLPSLA